MDQPSLFLRCLRLVRRRWPVIWLTAIFIVVSETSLFRRSGATPGLPLWGWLGVGLVLGVCAAGLLEYLRTTIENEEEVRRYVGLPLVGTCPAVRGGDVLLTRLPSKCPIAEVFHLTATVLHAKMSGADQKTLLVTSANAREGKTTIAIDLAVGFARKGLRTVLVDADLRRSAVHALLGLPNEVGVSTLAGSGLVAERGQATAVPNLFVLTAGPAPASPFELVNSKGMCDLVAGLKASADVVVVDSPPFNLAGDAGTLATLADACLLVVAAGIAHRDEVAFAKQGLLDVRATLLGVFLNRARAA